MASSFSGARLTRAVPSYQCPSDVWLKYLFCKCEALNSKPSPTKKKRKKNNSQQVFKQKLVHEYSEEY
jgi:hypothetical protein